LATTDVMLASTVQFSRYGRSRLPAALAGAAAGPGRGCLAAVPSGPNSVLGPRTPRERRPVPLHEARGVLADVSWYTDRITSAPLVSCHLRTFA
jgi:hypothetical protein